MSRTSFNNSALLVLILCVSLGANVLNVAQAQDADTSTDIEVLNLKVKEKQSAIDQLNRQIEIYQTKIDQAQSKEASLKNEVELLSNRIAKTELDIESVEASIDLANSELVVIEREIQSVQVELEKNRKLIADVLREIQSQDNRLPLLLMFGTDSLSELFDTLQQLENVSSDLKGAVENARSTEARLVERRTSADVKHGQLLSLETSLKRERLSLDDEVGAKEILIAATSDSEARFKQLMVELKEEQDYIDYQVSLLQEEIEGKLNAGDLVGDSSVLSWPIDPRVKGISAYFHDPTYPFRHLFEHSGIDLPSPTGTSVGCAAPGYVAWTKKGQMYGNYVMVIHANGIATLYAHLSRIDVIADQFVARGDTIGAVGSTGFSTGPHLHFEVRLNGIPSDPFSHLIGL
jgi:murein DD-endopeptidase MepM/ murein hydrolase activator NlpD